VVTKSPKLGLDLDAYAAECYERQLEVKEMNMKSHVVYLTCGALIGAELAAHHSLPHPHINMPELPSNGWGQQSVYTGTATSLSYQIYR
jgi:hypothetical protein